MQLNFLVYPAPEPSYTFDQLRDDPDAEKSLMLVGIPKQKSSMGFFSSSCISVEPDFEVEYQIPCLFFSTEDEEYMKVMGHKKT